MSAPDNPDAFPRDCEPSAARGMSLRDYFAGKALAGMHARDTYDEGQSTPQKRAAQCYLDADAMLAERLK